MRRLIDLTGKMGLTAAIAAAGLAVSATNLAGDGSAYAQSTDGSLGGFPLHGVKRPKPGGDSSPKVKGKREIVVDANGSTSYAKISDAVKDIADGGLIYVLHGVYHETLDIGKSVNLQGDRGPGPGVEIISRVGESCISYEPKETAAHAVVANVKFRAVRNAKVAALAGASDSTAPSACVEVAKGIFTLKESDVSGGCPLAPGREDRALLPGCSHSAVKIKAGIAILEKNRIYNGANGVLFDQKRTFSQSMLVDNKIWNNTTGVYLAGIADVFVAGNEIYQNLAAGLESDGIGGATLIGNKINNNSGNGIILHEKARDNLLRYNRILQNGGYGIYVPVDAPGVIENNELFGNTSGDIRFDRDAFRTKVLNNVFEGDDRRRRGRRR